MNIPKTDLKRVVVIGAGFGGLQVVKLVKRNNFQIVLIDRNNYHTFQPLLYQVATAILEPDSVICPIRSIIKNTENFFFRMAEVQSIELNKKNIKTNRGNLGYDYLVLATGSKTNFFGNKNMETFSFPMKSIFEAITLRNSIFQNIENALFTKDKNRLMTFVIVGGGPTGVELAGSLSEMKMHVLSKDYPDLNVRKIMNIHLVQASSRLLDGMSESSSHEAFKELKKMGVNILVNCMVKDYNGRILQIDSPETSNSPIETSNVIWAAGVKGALIDGFDSDKIEKGRLLVDAFNRVKGHEDSVFAIGDIALMKKDDTKGYPMLAQLAIQQGVLLAKNLNRMAEGKEMHPFIYKDMGAMAIICRNKAVCDFPKFRIKGMLAWIIWIFVHSIKLEGFRNRMITLTNWIIQYYRHNRGMRLIIVRRERDSNP
jgi:NADH:ubiquinone reductase (H+-translocating)